MAADHSSLTAQLEDTRQSLSDAKTDNARLITENDGLRGQIVRRASEHKESIEKLNADAKEQAQAHAQERAKASEEHSAALAGQRKELAVAAEQAENRLMVLLDQERQTAKESTAQLTSQLKEMSDNAQSNREKAIKLETSIWQLTEQNGKLASDLVVETARCSELSVALEEQKAQTSSIQRQFKAYKEKHKISGDLGALQAAVAALQAKLEVRKDE